MQLHRWHTFTLSNRYSSVSLYFSLSTLKDTLNDTRSALGLDTLPEPREEYTQLEIREGCRRGVGGAAGEAAG